MSRVYFTSDWHLGHRGIAANFRSGFLSDNDHDATIFENARKVLTKRDVTFFVGDISFTDEGLEMVNCLEGRKILVRGNHDLQREEMYHKVFDEVHGAYRYKGAFVTHIPIHPSELYRGFNIHGHCHRGGPREFQIGAEWRQYYNVIGEFNDYQLVPAEDIFAVLKGE